MDICLAYAWCAAPTEGKEVKVMLSFREGADALFTGVLCAMWCVVGVGGVIAIVTIANKPPHVACKCKADCVNCVHDCCKGAK